MLSNITLSNKTIVDPNRVITPTPDIELSDGTKIRTYSDSPSPNPIMFGRLNARDNPNLTDNTLVINVDGKDYLASELSAVFNPGREPVRFNVKDLIELDSVTSDVLYDVVLSHSTDNTLEIPGKYQELLDSKHNKDKDLFLQGFDITEIKVNNTSICFNSLELFTENNMLKAKGVFTLSNIKFSGNSVTTEATYYKEKEPDVYRYTFKPSKDLITEYDRKQFYMDKSVISEEEIKQKIAETVSTGWELYTIESVK
jgi:hypothetical protein